jgi:hypothetical protein
MNSEKLSTRRSHIRNHNSNADLQYRLEQAFEHPTLTHSPQKRRVLQFIVDHPDQLTRYINSAAGCGNVFRIVTYIARFILLACGIAMQCYKPERAHKTKFNEVSRVQC